MPERFIVFDTETPNARNNRMSAIGIAVVENGVISQEYATLVNPEAHFDDFNIRLTGITPEAAESAPTFPELWQTLQPLLDSGMPVAHNWPSVWMPTGFTGTAGPGMCAPSALPGLPCRGCQTIS